MKDEIETEEISIYKAFIQKVSIQKRRSPLIKKNAI